MWSLAAVKLGCLGALALLPLLCGLLPAALRCGTRPGSAGAQPWPSVVSCAAGGVFLATCLLDVVPDLRDELQRQSLALDFPLPELVVAVGFLLVLVAEHVVLECGEPRGDEAAPPLPPPGPEEQPPPREGFRALALALALSLHAVFEGLAVGLQDSRRRVLRLAGAVLLHKSLVAASLGLLLLRARPRLRLRWRAAALAAFALMAPLGLGLGMLVAARGSGIDGLGGGVRGTLQGLAAGTFLYVTFLEILPRELSAPAGRLRGVLALLLAFSAMAGLRLLG